MRRGLGLAILLVLVTAATGLHAEEPDRKVEIGAGLAAISVLNAGSGHLTIIGVPSAGSGPFTSLPPTLYAAVFTSPTVALESQLGFLALSGGGESTHFLSVGEQADFFLRDSHQSAPYLFGRGFLLNSGGGGEDGSSMTRFAAGTGVGCRVPLGERAAFRVEGRFDHIFPKGAYGDSVDVIGGYVAIGIRL